MSEQWLHKYVLEFGQPVSFYTGQGSNFRAPLSVEAQGTYDPTKINNYLKDDTSAVRITEHNITFRISKSKEGSKESSLTLYNISDATRKYLEQNQGNKPIIVLYAGYQSDVNLPLIFQGEIISMTERKEGATRITELVLKSGATNMTEAYTVRSYRAGTKFETIINDAINDLKLPKGTLILPKGNNVEAVLPKAVIVNNPTKDFLKRFCAANGYRFWIEDGCANVSPLQPQADGAVAFLISSSTNMIGSPTLASETPVMEKQAATRQDIKLKTTLNGAYSIGAKVQVESNYHSGVYEITGIEHTGTYEGNEWFSNLELKPIDGWEKAK